TYQLFQEFLQEQLQNKVDRVDSLFRCAEAALELRCSFTVVPVRHRRLSRGPANLPAESHPVRTCPESHQLPGPGDFAVPANRRTARVGRNFRRLASSRRHLAAAAAAYPRGASE